MSIRELIMALLYENVPDGSSQAHYNAGMFDAINIAESRENELLARIAELERLLDLALHTEAAPKEVQQRMDLVQATKEAK